VKRFVGAFGLALTMACDRPSEPVRYPPVVVMSPFRSQGVLVEGASRGWWKLASHPVRYGDPMPVTVTMYCLQGTTRRGRYVRPGIIAADPRFFPMARYVELYVGRKYYGRFLVDDTGRKIKGNHIDVWLPSCTDARKFGVKRGTAVLMPRLPQVQQAGAPKP